MHLLLDTHALIWFLNGDKQLSSIARTAIEKNDGINYVSVASLWEIAIKISLNKLESKKPFAELESQLSKNGFQLLPVMFPHFIRVSELTFHHRDPFDRLIIAQALSDNLKVVTKDKLFSSYKVKCIW